MSATSRPQTRGEEIANSVTHGLALVASLAAVPVLLVGAARADDAARLAGGVVFGVTLVLMYLASTCYHAVPAARTRAKHALRVLDHAAIYLLIAGTYTPFLLGPLRGPWGTSLLVVIWTLAALGVVAKLCLGFRFPRLSTVVYLVMGWLILVALRPLVTHVSPEGVRWLVAGGLCYTAGVAFYVADRRVRYAHAVWHLFVAGGSTCHFLAVLWHTGAARG